MSASVPVTNYNIYLGVYTVSASELVAVPHIQSPSAVDSGPPCMERSGGERGGRHDR